jgi:biotin transporter BioY
MMILVYPVLAIGFVWIALKVTKTQEGSWKRHAILSSVIAILFAPSFLGGGHGYAIGPAWMAMYQQAAMEGGSGKAFLILGVAPILTAAVTGFVAARVWSSGRKRKVELQ